MLWGEYKFKSIRITSYNVCYTKLLRIEEIEPSNFRIPVLLKKYLKQNAHILAFNVDPKFNYSLDGLMLLDLLEIPVNTIQSLSKELGDQGIAEQFYSRLLAGDEVKDFE